MQQLYKQKRLSKDLYSVLYLPPPYPPYPPYLLSCSLTSLKSGLPEPPIFEIFGSGSSQGEEAGEIILRTWGNSFALGKAF